MKSIIVVAFILLSSFASRASHLLGGEIYYDYIGNDQYVVTIQVFRDCENGGAILDPTMDVSVFNTFDNSPFDTVLFNLVMDRSLFLETTPTLVLSRPGLCVERGTYIDTLTLPMTPSGYYVAYQRGNWANSIINMDSLEIAG